MAAWLWEKLGGARPRIEAGESAVAGLAACLAACGRAPLKAELGLNTRSQVLVFGTEGATDRGIYDAIVAGQCGQSNDNS